MPLPPYFGSLVLKAKHGLWHRLWAALFGSWIELGDPVFDSAFWIGGPREHASSALTPPVRAALLAFRRQEGRFAIEGGRLFWSRRTFATEQLDRVIDAMRRLGAELRGPS